MANNKSRYTFIEFIQNYSIRIPLIQRDYVQGREYTDEKKLEKRQEFIRLLMDALKDGKVYHVDFIYGSPVQNQKSGTGKSFFIPLDGQQRLTTLFLLHWILISKSTRDESDKIELLSKIGDFSYETRLSSAAFCTKLTSNLIPELENGNVKKVISDQPWYSSDWDYDPTICNMLSMLEAMNTMLECKYKSFIDIMLDNALSTDSSITFDLLDMKEYALTDGLYIKMNARGKELTNFEHWKALFIQLLEDNYKDEGLKDIFTDKIEHDWANLFWDYVKDDGTKYPVIDDCFMSYFHYLTNIFYYSYIYPQQGEKKIEYIETVEQIYSVYKKPNCIDILFKSLDFLSVVGRIDSPFFEELFRHGNEKKDDDRIRLFSKGRINLLQRCIITQENEDFDIYEKSLLYAVIRYCTNHCITTVTPELKKYVRVIRNLLINTSQFIQAQVNLISNLRITEFESYNRVIESLASNINVADSLVESITGLGGKNAASIEKEKLGLSERNLICWLEDMPFCRGNISALKYLLNYPSDRIIKTISLFNEATDAEKVRLLIASGYYGMGIGWCSYGYRYFFGKDGRWNVVFTRDAENIGIALKAFADADCSIETYINNNIPTEHGFRYYALKYGEFVRSAGYWQNINDLNSYYYFAVNGEDFDDLDMISLKSYSKSPLLAYHTEPMASIVLWKLIEEDPVTFGNNRLRNCNIYAEKASLTYFKNEEVIFSLKINNRKWQLEQVNNLPEDLQNKYHIEDNYLDECDGLDLVMVAIAFIKEYISRI